MKARYAPIFAVIAATLLTSTAALQSGCNGCNQPTAQNPPPAPNQLVRKEANKAIVENADKATTQPVAVKHKTRYLGPQSRNDAGYKLTSGFADAQDEAIRQPVALERNTFYVTALSQEDRPIGELDKVAGADVHAMLVATDLRQALYARADSRVADGVDARGLSFTPREGGEHALIVVFKPTGSARTQTVSTPVVIKGALPTVVGPGLASLGRTSGEKTEVVQLDLDKPPMVGHEAVLSASRPAATKDDDSPTPLPAFVVVYNDQMGFGEVLHLDDKGQVRWTPARSGLYLVLAPPAKGVDALAFKLEVSDPPTAQPTQGQR